MTEFSWDPGEMICDITIESAHAGPPQFTVPAQHEPYTVDISWGGRSLSDTGARGGAYLVYRDLSSPEREDVELGFKHIEREFPDDGDKREHWVVRGHIGPHVISANTEWRATTLYRATNEHFVNAVLKIRFISGV